MVRGREWSKSDDEALDQCLWWQKRETEHDTLLSLGLVIRVLFGKCRDDSEQWAIWAGADWTWPLRFICPGCGAHWINADRWEEWPVNP